MKQIIDGKRYNTQTAQEIATWHNGIGRSDFHCLEETLYLTQKGAWFIEYWGGALTSYARSCGSNSTCGDSGLIAFSAEQAFQWLQDHQEAAALEQYFPDRIQDA